MAQQTSVTLDYVASSFLQHLPNAAPEAQQEVNNLIRWFGKDAALNGLTPRDVEEYCGLVGTNGEDTAARRIKLLRQFFTHVDEQGALDVKLAPHVKLRRASRAQQPSLKKPRRERPQLTAEGHARLRERLALLQDELVRVADDIRHAAADKDVRENAPLEAARQHQGQIMTQIRELEVILDNAVVITELAKVAEARVRQGNRVTVRDLGAEREVSFHLVDPSEVNPLGGRISTASPIGRALMDHTVGDEVTVATPRGSQRYRIILVE